MTFLLPFSAGAYQEASLVNLAWGVGSLDEHGVLAWAVPWAWYWLLLLSATCSLSRSLRRFETRGRRVGSISSEKSMVTSPLPQPLCHQFQGLGHSHDAEDARCGESQPLSWALGSEQPDQEEAGDFPLVNAILFSKFSLLVLKGLYHYWTYVHLFQGT